MDGRTERLEDLEFLTREDLVERKIVGRSMSYEYGKSDSKYYDPDFPKPIRIKGRVRFRAGEIKAWLDIVEIRTNGSPCQDKHIPEHGSRTQVRNRTAELSSLVEKTRLVLTGIAKSGSLISYPKAMAHLRLWHDIPADLSLFEEILAEVSKQSYQQSQLLLSVVVSTQVSEAKPSEAFVDLATKLGCSGLDRLWYFIKDQRIRLWHQLNPGREGVYFIETASRMGNTLLARDRSAP